MDCLAFVVIEISGSRQSISRDGADLGEFCAAVLRRLATAEQKDSENQGNHGDGPISHLIPPEAGPLFHPTRSHHIGKNTPRRENALYSEDSERLFLLCPAVWE
jgi:hypothetical protein